MIFAVPQLACAILKDEQKQMAFDQDDLFHDEKGYTKDRVATKKSEIKIDGVTLETTPVFDAFWYFACERQNMFRRKLRGLNSSQASDDWILSTHKFTNSYRASDRVSQYLIRQVIWSDSEQWSDDDLFFRTLFFKLFNRIDTWEAVSDAFGDICLNSYKFDLYDELLSERQQSAICNYSAAYIMPSAGRVFGHTAKHSNHLRLLEWMLDKNYPSRLKSCASMSDAFELLLEAPSIGPFLAYQYVTDLNYSSLTEFSEMEFVVAGPGALDGISKCFTDRKGVAPERIISHMAETQSDYFDYYAMQFDDLWGRPLQLIDCQNIFCEISKYARAAFPEIAGRSGRSRIKQKYKSAGLLPRPWYPPDWALNEKIAMEFGPDQTAGLKGSKRKQRRSRST